MKGKNLTHRPDGPLQWERTHKEASTEKTPAARSIFLIRAAMLAQGSIGHIWHKSKMITTGRNLDQAGEKKKFKEGLQKKHRKTGRNKTIKNMPSDSNQGSLRRVDGKTKEITAEGEPTAGQKEKKIVRLDRGSPGGGKKGSSGETAVDGNRKKG